jgi:hypothetical protein
MRVSPGTRTSSNTRLMTIWRIMLSTMSRDAVGSAEPRSRLERRVVAAAEDLLAQGGSVSPVDVLM